MFGATVRVAKSRKHASGAWSHKSCCGATFTSMIKYFWRSEMKKSKLLHKHPSYHQIFVQQCVYCTKLNSIKVSNPFVQGFWVLVPNYVANYGVFVSNFMSQITLFLEPHFNPPKSRWCHKTTF